MATCNFDSSPGRDRFIRLTRLLIAGGTPILREVLRSYHNPSTLAAALVGKNFGFTKPQKQLLFPADPPGSLPNFYKFDICLIFKLLKNCCGLTEPGTKWNNLPAESDKSLEADIVRIYFYRNDMYGHTLEHMAICTQEDFDKYWDIISAALCRIATILTGSATTLRNQIQELRRSRLTDDDLSIFKEYFQNNKLSSAQQDKKLDNIKQGIERIELQCTKISDDKTTRAAAPLSVQYKDCTISYHNHFAPNVSSVSAQGQQPGLPQGTIRSQVMIPTHSISLRRPQQQVNVGQGNSTDPFANGATAARTCNTHSDQGFSRESYQTSSRDRKAKPVNPLVYSKPKNWLSQRQQEDQEFKDSGRHSQILSQVGMAACDASIPSETIRSQSVMDLPSTLKTALQELLQLICSYEGRMDWQKAKKLLSRSSYIELTKPAFTQYMSRYFEILPDNVVQVKLKFCPKMRKDSTCDNTNCPDLHLCFYHFLTDDCQYTTNCKNSHNISDDHTDNMFKMANLSFLNVEQRKQLVRNVAYVAPEICIYYNKRSNVCTKGSNCPYLHVCKDWVGGSCGEGSRCQRAHAFSNPHEKDILKKKNLDQKSEKEIIHRLKENFD